MNQEMTYPEEMDRSCPFNISCVSSSIFFSFLFSMGFDRLDSLSSREAQRLLLDTLLSYAGFILTEVAIVVKNGI